MKRNALEGMLTVADVVGSVDALESSFGRPFDEDDEDDAERWRRIDGPGANVGAAPGAFAFGRSADYWGADAASEAFFDEARRISRDLCLNNPFAINALENRVNFVVGLGHKYQATPRDEADFDLARRTQDVVVEFVVENDWFRRQQEILRRFDRDGEAFLRFFRDARGKTVVRHVEPEQVRTPIDATSRTASGASTGASTGVGRRCACGIVADARDAETILGYWIDGVYVESEKIQHRKANVDATARRGIPLLYPVRENLRRAEKLLRNMSVVAEIQSSIALIRKHSNASGESVRRFVRDRSAASGAGDGRGRGASGEFGRERFQPGTIVDATAGIEYEFPVAAVDASRYVQILQAELRAIASRLTLPEYMLSADASNANYSSTTIAESPAIRNFERLQHETIKEDMKVVWRVVADAVARGALPEDVAERVSIQAIPPSLAVRDRLDEARADEILIGAGVVSRQTTAMKYGLDPTREAALRRRAEEEDRTDANV